MTPPKTLPKTAPGMQTIPDYIQFQLEKSTNDEKNRNFHSSE